MEEDQTTKNSTAVYVNKYGMENRITSFRLSSSLRKRLADYAAKTGKDPSAVIREAIADYLRQKDPIMGVAEAVKLNGWTAKSTKL